ncbi:MAG TPA: hypothetical protein VK754_07085 [Propionibacteriaceae bacterium]|nr:hypothetical protein [Propionibacteriaceae bacterium]
MPPEEGEQRWVGAGIFEHVNGGGVDVVVLIAFPFFFELVEEELELAIGDVAERLVGGGVVELDHWSPSRD